MDYSDPENATKTADEIYDADTNDIDEEMPIEGTNITTVAAQEHTVKQTGTATVITMQQWIDDYDMATEMCIRDSAYLVSCHSISAGHHRRTYFSEGRLCCRSSRMVLWAGCTVSPESVPHAHAAVMENGQRNAHCQHVAGDSGSADFGRAFGVFSAAVLSEAVSDV